MTIRAIRRDAATAEFFDGTALGEFRLKRSRTTGEILAPQCLTDSAGSVDLEWITASGFGRVVSWAVTYGKPVDGPRDGIALPTSVVGIVELDEGPLWWCELLDADPAAMRMGLPVTAAFVRPEDSDETVPVFRVVAD
jgi:uncharacterized OB-fold protein